MQAADQTGVIGVKADRHQIDLEVGVLENDVGARNRKLADPALSKAAADHDAFGVGPGLGLEKPLRHIGELQRETLDRAMHQGGSMDVVPYQRLIQRALADRLGGFAAERVVAVLLQWLAQAVQNPAKCALAGAVPEKAFVVLQL